METVYYVGAGLPGEEKLMEDERGEGYRTHYDFDKFSDFELAKSRFINLLSNIGMAFLEEPEFSIDHKLEVCAQLAADIIHIMEDMKPESFNEDHPVWLVTVDELVAPTMTTMLPNEAITVPGPVPTFKVVNDHSLCTPNFCQVDFKKRNN